MRAPIRLLAPGLVAILACIALASAQAEPLPDELEPPPEALTIEAQPDTTATPATASDLEYDPVEPLLRIVLHLSPFERAQVVSFYGYPGVGVMGELGLHSPAGAAEAVARVAAEYDALNGPRDVIPALHLIVAVAQAHPGKHGLYLARMKPALIAEYVEAARDAGALLFLDVQIGWSDTLTEVRVLEEALREPFVHLALDPEFATKERGKRPGRVVGSLGAADVNAVQHYLAGIVRDHALPPKVLVLHQFLQSMLTDVEDYDDVPEVDVTIDMDGFGAPHVKLRKYRWYAVSDYAERAAIKLFYHWDAPLLAPADLLALEHPPDLVIYQ